MSHVRTKYSSGSVFSPFKLFKCLYTLIIRPMLRWLRKRNGKNKIHQLLNYRKAGFEPAAGGEIREIDRVIWSPLSFFFPPFGLWDNKQMSRDGIKIVLMTGSWK